MKKYKFIEHTSDIAVKVTGETPEDLFVQASRALKEALLEHAEIQYPESRIVELTAESLEELLVDFLNELNYLITTKGWFFDDVRQISAEIENHSWKLRAECSGERRNDTNEFLKVEIKSITYHQLKIIKKDGELSTLIVFDI